VLRQSKLCLKGKTNDERLISAILFPTMQLKANGGMFHYSLVTQISDRLIQFLEVVDEVDQEAIEIIMAFHTTVRAILLGQIRGGWRATRQRSSECPD
jgi:hypothetical protein